MPVTWRREYLCECDKCLRHLMLDDVDTKFKNPTPKTYKRIAKKYGWEIMGNNCLCPNCKGVEK